MSQNFTVSVPKLKFQKLSDAAIPQALEAASKLAEHFRWWWINGNEMILDSHTGLLWQGAAAVGKTYTHESQAAATADSTALKLGGISGWRVPKDKELRAVVEQDSFPLRKGKNNRLKGYQLFLTKDAKSLNLDTMESQNSERDIPIVAGGLWFKSVLSTIDAPYKADTALLPVCELFAKKPSAKKMIEECSKRSWHLRPHVVEDGPAIISDPIKGNINPKDYAYTFSCLYGTIKASGNLKDATITAERLQTIWGDIDYISARLPKLDTLRFTDVNQGVWEFFSDNSPRLSLTINKSIRSRDPVLDVRQGNVAIDFGTSSTVVAFRENGRDQLLRIGLNDFYKTPESEHYENPTVLEIVDFKQFYNDWTSEAYRPLVQWDSVRCSHEARASLRNNNTNSRVVGSILLRLKQWALRNKKNNCMRITDQVHQHEHELASLVEFNPVKGKPLTVDKNYAFDPIELYAWFLGLTINWRQRGIFLHYYMTFPVAYPREIKDKILASFRRGLQRSLPAALVSNAAFNDFLVEERASEPTAFAAAALSTLNIEPTEEGAAYAVFDFGGGTTDFDYGFYRLPTHKEESDGWEHVLEHFGSSGDAFLGGENLLENMAYRVFCANTDVCRKSEIAFTKPLDGEDFPGSELLIAQTQAAITNTTMLMSKLRPLWEKGEKNKDTSGSTQIKLTNRHGKDVECDFKVKEDELLTYLETRIQQGLHNFFVAMKQAFTGQTRQTYGNLPEIIHLLLAGNSSRSQIVLGLLGRLDDERSKKLYERTTKDLAKIFGETMPNVEVHLPLQPDAKDFYKPTAKTGVALGLLRLCPGERLMVINHAKSEMEDSPFQWFVGTHKRNVFVPKLLRGAPYQQWVELGVILENTFYLPYSSAPRASLNMIQRGDTELHERKLGFAGNTSGHRVYACAVGPAEIRICTAASLADVEAGSGNNIQTLTLC